MRFDLRRFNHWCEGFAPLLVRSRITVVARVPFHHQGVGRVSGSVGSGTHGVAPPLNGAPTTAAGGRAVKYQPIAGGRKMSVKTE